MGEWIGKNNRIPIVGITSNQDYVIAICEWNKSMELEKVLELSHTMKEAKIDPSFLYLFSNGGFSNALIEYSKDKDNIVMITM